MADDFERLVRAVETAARPDPVTGAPASWRTIVLAMLEEIRKPGDAALVEGAATIPECAEFFRKTHALRCHVAMIDVLIAQADGGKR